MAWCHDKITRKTFPVKFWVLNYPFCPALLHCTHCTSVFPFVLPSVLPSVLFSVLPSVLLCVLPAVLLSVLVTVLLSVLLSVFPSLLACVSFLRISLPQCQRPERGHTERPYYHSHSSSQQETPPWLYFSEQTSWFSWGNELMFVPVWGLYFPFGRWVPTPGSFTAALLTCHLRTNVARLRNLRILRRVQTWLGRCSGDWCEKLRYFCG